MIKLLAKRSRTAMSSGRISRKSTDFQEKSLAGVAVSVKLASIPKDLLFLVRICIMRKATRFFWRGGLAAVLWSLAGVAWADPPQETAKDRNVLPKNKYVQL